MLLTIIHLSDIHFRVNEGVDNIQLNKICQVLNSFGSTGKIVIVCSGDVAYSAKKEEYAHAVSFFRNLVNLLQKKTKFDIPIYVVPGNHDMDLSEDRDIRNSKITNAYFANDIESLLSNEKEKFKNFENFCQDDLINSFNENILFDSKYIDLNDSIKIQFNLINTAFFSSLDHNDKDNHYFDLSLLNQFKGDKSDFVISIMHHTTEWLHENYKRQFEDVLYKESDIIFSGHTHIRLQSDVCRDGDIHFNISSGGQLINFDNNSESEFNIIQINFEEMKKYFYKCSWDSKEEIFRIQKIRATSNLKRKKDDLEINTSFLEKLNENFLSKNIEDFVFPELSQINNDNGTISNIDEFVTFFKNKTCLNIIGDFNSSKTSFLVYLVNSLSPKYKVIYISASDIFSKKLDKIIKNSFEEMYGEDPVLFEKYMQLDKNQKILIIDDVDKISKIKPAELVNTLEDYYGHFILSSTSKIEVDILEDLKANMNEKISALKILPFYKIKRNELIRKVVIHKLGSENEEKVRKIENCIINSSNIRGQYPSFIIQYAIYVLNNEDYENTTSFNAVFESNLVNRIKESDSSGNVDEYIYILKDLAYFMHKYKQVNLKESEVYNIIQQYNIRTGSSISVSNFINSIKRSRIFIENGDQYRFENQQTLAYFIANKISDIYFNNEIEGRSDIKYLLKNICFDINSEVFLFLIYFQKHYKILNEIEIYASSLFNNWEPWSLQKGNITIFMGNNKLKDILLPTKNEIIEMNKTENDMEREIDTTNTLDYLDLYNYKEEEADSFTNTLTSAIKYLDLICKILPRFYAMLEVELKEIMIEMIFDYTNRLIYGLLKPVDDSYDEVINDIYQFMIINLKKKNISKDDVNIEISTFLRNFILSIYYHYASSLVSNKTMTLVKQFFINENKNIQKNIDVSLYIYYLVMIESMNNTSKLISIAEEIERNFGNNYNKQYYIRQVMRLHIIKNTSISYKERQMIINKYFTSRTTYFTKNESSKLYAISQKKNSVNK